MQLNLGSEFDQAVITAAGLDGEQYQPSSLVIDFDPAGGDATVRMTAVATLDAATLTGLITSALEPPS